MTLSANTPRVVYSGNGVTTAFSFPYTFLADADLKVIQTVDSTGVPTAKTLTTHYTVTGAGVDGGGTVTMLTAPPTGTKLVLYQDNALEQDLNLVANDPVPVEEIEERFDKLTMFAQRFKSWVSRAVRLNDGFTATFDPTLPDVLTAEYLLCVNDAGTGMAQISKADAVSDASGSFLMVANDLSDVASPATARSSLKIARVTGSKAVPTDVTTAGITPTAGYFEQAIFVQGSGGAVDITANPQIVAGTLKGQILELIGCSDTNTLLLEHGTGLDMNGSITLALNWSIRFRWDETAWVEVSRSERT